MKLWSKYKNSILNLSLKKIYSKFFLNDFKKNGYFSYLKELYFDFLSNKFSQLDKNKFDKKLTKLIADQNSYTDLMGELYDIFEPTYTNDLNYYYKLYEKHIFFRFLTYSINPKLIKKKYSDIYSFAINQINEPLDILEVGGGVPHVLRFNSNHVGNCYQTLVKDIGRSTNSLADSGDILADIITSFLALAGIPKNLHDCGVSHGILEVLAEEASEQWTAKFNPRPVQEKDLLEIYQLAMV